jgi:hypothetical protein
VEKVANKVLAALAAVAGLVGYVILVGGIVVGVRVEQDRLSSEAIVSATPHDELFLYGIETIAAWLALLAIGALGSLVIANRRGPVKWYLPVSSAVAGALGCFFAVDLGEKGLWGWFTVVVVAAIVALVVAVSRADTGWGRTKPLLVWLLGAALAMGVILLFENHNAPAMGCVLGIVASLVLIGLGLAARGSYPRRVSDDLTRLAEEERKSLNDAPTGERARIKTRYAELRAKAAKPWRLERLAEVSTPVLTAVLVAYTAIAIAVGGIVLQLDRRRAFNSARITLENGNCVEGSYITRNDTEILVAGKLALRDKKPRRVEERPSLISLRRDEVAEIQIRGPRSGISPLVNARCRTVLSKPTAGEDTGGGKKGGGAGIVGQVGPSGPSGPAGAPGGAGTDGTKGPAGPTGPKGATGAKGDTGARGARGSTGPPGRRGTRGPRGRSDTGR